MKTIEIEEDLYLYIAGQTKHIGESASDILRRLLLSDAVPTDVINDVSSIEEHVEEVASNQAEDPVSVEIAIHEQAAELPSQEPVLDLLEHFNFEEIAEAGSSTKRFLALLTSLYGIDDSRFAKACIIKGSKREYFSIDKEALLASGKTSKPQAITNTPYWVITNTNTARKRHILHHVASEMGFAEFQIERLCEAI